MKRLRRFLLGLSALDLAIAVWPSLSAAQATQGGLLPVPDYSGDWRSRAYLTGEWGGLRTRLAEKGATLGLGWTSIAQGIESGGLDQRWAIATNLDYTLTLDLDRMGLLPGALVTARGQSRFGQTVNQDTGLLLPVNTYSYFPFTSNVDQDVGFALTELNYLQFLFDEFGLLAGKVTTMKNANEFAGGEGRTQFMNFQFLWSAVFAQVVPYSTLAVGGLWLPSTRLAVTSLLMNLKDASTTTGFDDIGEGTTWWTSIDYQYRWADLPGGGSVGGVYAFDGDFGRIGGINIDPGSGPSVERKGESWLVYWSGWQYVFTEERAPDLIDAQDGRQDLEGLGLFAMLGFGDRTTNPVTWSLAGGLSGRGLVPCRDDDTLGLGYFFNRLEDPRTLAGRLLANSTQGLEAYYNVAVTGAVALTLDLQWTMSARPRVEDSVILAARLDVVF